ncbi:Uncharacterized protein SCF082_LOCUS25501, partial [Durusdinium trenchii]
ALAASGETLVRSSDLDAVVRADKARLRRALDETGDVNPGDVQAVFAARDDSPGQIDRVLTALTFTGSVFYMHFDSIPAIDNHVVGTLQETLDFMDDARAGVFTGSAAIPQGVTAVAGGGGIWAAWASTSEASAGVQEKTNTSTNINDFVGKVFDQAQAGCFPSSWSFSEDDNTFVGVCREKAAPDDFLLAYSSSTTAAFDFVSERAAEGFFLEAVVFGEGYWLIYMEAVPSGAVPKYLVGLYPESNVNTMENDIITNSAEFGPLSAIGFGGGRYLFMMHPTIDNLEPGQGLTAAPTPAPVQTPAPTNAPTRSDREDYIELAFINPVSSGIEGAFRDAADKLNRLIVSGGPGFPIGQQISNLGNTRCNVEFPFASTDVINGLLITANIIPIDGPGRILGRAGPCLTFQGFTLVGTMEFDLNDIERMLSNGSLTRVIMHEMLHVMGIGTLWDPLVSGLNTNDPRFFGNNGVEGFNDLGGQGNTVPVANTGGAGTFGGHWREATFQSELMTGFASGSNELSIMTVKALKDLGFQVDEREAEPYQIPGISVVTPENPPPPDLGNDDIGTGVDDLTPTDPVDNSNLLTVLGGVAGVVVVVGAAAALLVRRRRLRVSTPATRAPMGAVVQPPPDPRGKFNGFSGFSNTTYATAAPPINPATDY